MKRNITIFVFFIFKLVFPQELHHQCICSKGENTSTFKGYKISQSIGQLSQIGNYKSKSIIVQQGYQQCFNKMESNLFKSIECKVYPNPTKDYLTISFDKNLNEPITLILSDISGKLILKWSKIYSKDYQISLKEISEGTYILVIEMNKSRLYKKIIKQNEK